MGISPKMSLNLVTLYEEIQRCGSILSFQKANFFVAYSEGCFNNFVLYVGFPGDVCKT